MAVGCSAAALAAGNLSVQDITSLSAAGIGDEAIIAKIHSAGARFDLSTDDIIALKNQGISGPVLAAMMGAGASNEPQYSIDSPDPAALHPAGIYLTEMDGQKMGRIDATVSDQAKTGGILGYALTGGIASLSVKAAIQGEHARSHSKASQPVFYFFFDESNPTSGGKAGTWAAGDGTSVTSPAEFTLVSLDAKHGRREARVGSVNIGGAKTGVMDKDRLAFDYAMVRPGVYRVTPKAALAPGEYGFIYSLRGGGRNGMLTAKVFDFGIG